LIIFLYNFLEFGNDVSITRKKNIFERIKNTVSVPGFRKGSAPQEVVEQKANIEVLYKPLIDEIYLEVSSQYEPVSSKDFLFFSHLFSEACKFAKISKLHPS
jgi:hypothetical protein